MTKTMRVYADLTCESCGNPRPGRLRLCWACYWRSRPDVYAAKVTYNRERSRRIAEARRVEA